MPIALIPASDDIPEATPEVIPVKRGRGRPPGALNKKKPPTPPPPEPPPEPPAPEPPAHEPPAPEPPAPETPATSRLHR